MRNLPQEERMALMAARGDEIASGRAEPENRTIITHMSLDRRRSIHSDCDCLGCKAVRSGL